MIGEADDLMLSLMQVADDTPAPEASPKAAGPLSRLKPYPHHKGSCLGAVQVCPGQDEEDNLVLLFRCVKCGKDEIVPMLVEGDTGAVKVPGWVEPPNV